MTIARGRIAEDPPGDRLPLELCTGQTPECPHYACPDGWHAGDAPNCSCTPDCALGEDGLGPDDDELRGEPVQTVVNGTVVATSRRVDL